MRCPTSIWKGWRLPDYINGIIALAAVVTAFFSMQVWREAAKATKLAKLSAISANRAWIVPLTARLKPTEDGKAVTSVEVLFQNYGKEPAFHVFHEAADGFSKMPESLPLRSSELRTGKIDPCKIENAGKTTNIIHAVPGHSYSVFLDPGERNLSTDAQKSRVYYVNGCFSYVTFGQTHHSSYCFFLDPENVEDLKKRSFSLCDQGNDAD